MRLLLAMFTAVFLVSFSFTETEAQKGWKTYTVEDEFSFQYPGSWKLEAIK
jgi:hypothetical protein